jgi:glutamate synthase (NADPH/NADH) small chain
LPDNFAQHEVGFILAIGGVELRHGQQVKLGQLRRDFDAVFIGVGQGGVRGLDLPGMDLAGVHNAVDYIAALRQTDLAGLPVGAKVVVIGGGNTAIDIAVQSKRLGAEDVTIAYRRGPKQMGATRHEQDFAQINGVRIKHWLQPVRLESEGGEVRAAVFASAQTAVETIIPCDMVFKAVGQTYAPVADDGLELADGRIAIDRDGRTSLSDVWAGGDCVAGEDLTVQAAQDGKLAARAIDAYLQENRGS